MKKIFSGLLYGVIIYSIIANNVKAQMTLASVSSSKTTVSPALAFARDDKPGDEKVAAGKANVKESEANLKAVKANLKAVKANFKAAASFKKDFKDGPDVKWHTEEQVISAYFDRDGIQTYVIYNKKGNWAHTMAYCGEGKLPKNIKYLIRSNYPDYDIKGMQEIKEGNITFNIVYLKK